MTSPTTAFFNVETGLEDQKVIPIGSPSVIAGNSDAVDLRIDNRFVSRRHFQVRFETDVFYISDLGSTNGTYLNGTRLPPQEEHILRDGDRVGLAVDKVIIVFSEPSKTVRIDTAVIRAATKGQVAPDLVVDSGSRDVSIMGQRLSPPLSKKEFDVLELLYRERGNAVSRDAIAKAGWPERPDGDVTPEEIDQYIRRLRRRIEEDPSKPRLIVTLRGHGYRIP
jgi:hypothetical protein